MSYCRWGPDSDVYVYATERVIKDDRVETWWVCAGCELFADNPSIGIGPIYAPTLDALRDHLQRHRAAGHKVPDAAFERIDREMAEKPDEPW